MVIYDTQYRYFEYVVIYNTGTMYSWYSKVVLSGMLTDIWHFARCAARCYAEHKGRPETFSSHRAFSHEIPGFFL